jgi:drug/metabolite transporter (DMT)-like permease
VLWGLAFVATRIGLDELSPPQLTAGRFLVAAAPVLVVARPRAIVVLRRHPTAVITPFALLVPFVAAASSALVFGERFGPVRLLGMALVVAGLGVIVLLPARRAVA